MNPSDGHSDHLAELLSAASDGWLGDEKRQELTELLRNDRQARAAYIEYAIVQAMLVRKHGSRATDSFASVFDRDVTSPSVLPAIPVDGAAWFGGYGHVSSGWPVAYLIATVVLGIGLIVGSVLHAPQPMQVVLPSHTNADTPEHSGDAGSLASATVGRITGTVDCVFTNDELPTRANGIPYSPVALGDTLSLRSGLLEITYNTGAKVILQGPVTYKVNSAAGGYLSIGKLTAKLEEESGIPANHESEILNHKSFAVTTPTAIVTDLGTEFGIEVTNSGTTISRVFRGTVELRTIAVGEGSRPAVRVLHANEAAKVEVGKKDQGDGKPTIVAVASDKAGGFVRRISAQQTRLFDLVDVVAGGNGFSGRRCGGINPATGEATSTPPKVREARYAGDRQYHRVQGLPFVDGVFIPDGNAGRVQVDSAGHFFEDFPKTENLTCAYIWAGGEIPLDNVYKGLTVLNGVDYSCPDHGVLFLHANKGITFDLAAIRKANPGFTPVRFRTVTGSTEANGAAAMVDVWVLVDGRVAYRRREINCYSGVLPIDIAIHDKTRFLTLVATDSGNSISGDVIIFGDPQLEMTGLKSPANDTK